MLTVVTVIMGDETFGPSRSPQLGVVWLANAGWILSPLLVLVRMARSRSPFGRRGGGLAGAACTIA